MDAETTIDIGRTDGAFAMIASMADLALADAAGAFKDAMRTAYWEHKDVHLVTALAYAGVDRLLSGAAGADEEAATAARHAAKGLVYDLASFTWPGWGEADLVIAPSDEAAGLAAARTNLAMALDLERGDTAVSRAWWMLGAHLLTAGRTDHAAHAFAEAAAYAEAADLPVEVDLSLAFVALSELAGGAGDEAVLDSRLEALGAHDDGASFVEQVTTARRVVGC